MKCSSGVNAQLNIFPSIGRTFTDAILQSHKFSVEVDFVSSSL